MSLVTHTFSHVHACLHWEPMKALTEDQKLRKNELRVKQRAEAAAKRRSTRREGAREEVVSNLISSIIKKVVQKAKARGRTMQWKQENTDRVLQKNKDEYAANKAAAKSAGLSYEDWKAARKEKNKSKEPYDANRRHKERRASDVEFLIVTRLRTRLTEFMRLTNGTKAFGTMELVGCTQKFLVSYLQDQLPTGQMLKDYSIDHIFPITAYDMTCPEEQRRCMNYTNLQPIPLSGIGGNTSKGNHLPHLQLASRVSRNCWPASLSESDLN